MNSYIKEILISELETLKEKKTKINENREKCLNEIYKLDRSDDDNNLKIETLERTIESADDISNLK